MTYEISLVCYTYLNKYLGQGGKITVSYSILRVAKVKSSTASKGIQKHNQRENENYGNKDIDHDRTHLNYDLIHDKNIDYKNRMEQVIEEGYNGQRKVRSDAIKHVDGIITSDKDFFDSLPADVQNQYFKDSLEFVKKEYGEKNLLYATVHLDEKTPHMHFGFVPLTEDGRLSAKDVVGNKKALSLLQDRFNDFINEKGYNLERGERGSDDKHLDMQKFKEKTLQEKINGLENEFVEKQAELKVITGKMVNLYKAWDETKQVDQIEVKEGGLIGPKTVKLARSDFESIKTTAKVSESLKMANTGLKQQVKQVSIQNTNLEKQNHMLQTKVQSVTKQNQELKKENGVLKQENKFLQRTIVQVKVHFKEQVHDISLKIGALKANVLDKMKLPLLTKHFTDDKEIHGAQSFIQQRKKEQEKIKNQEKNNEQKEKSLKPKRQIRRDDFEMER